MSALPKISFLFPILVLLLSTIYLYRDAIVQQLDAVFPVALGPKDTRYVLMIDAGSAGSRIHIFSFEDQSSNPKLLGEEFEYVIPGLSGFEDPTDAAKSLEPLMEKAMQVVPKECHHLTPIAVKATAGLRLLGRAQSQWILQQVGELLEQYPFRPLDVGILDGKDEGVYAWTTVNYLLDNLNTTTTAAVFDLGGASSQVVFEPDFTVYPEDEAERLLSHGDHRYDMKFGDRHHTLYQHSHLGYGLMEARKLVHKTLAEEQKGRSMFWNELKVKDGDVLVNPCIATGQQRTVQIDVSPNGSKRFVAVDMVGPEGDNDGTQCLELSRKVLKLDRKCASGHCAFNGVHQPSITQTFATEQLYIVSYFYDRIFPLNLEMSFPLSKLYQLTSNVCQGNAAWQNEYYEALDQLNDRPEWCLDLSYMTVLLHDGYGVPMDRQLTIGKQVDGYGLSWSLGAALQLLKLPIEAPEI